MEPNLHTDQRLVVEKLSYRFHGPRRGDIVVIRVPSQGDELLIKRVIGLPGETVEIRDGRVYIDGQLLDEPYASGSTRQGRIGQCRRATAAGFCHGRQPQSLERFTHFRPGPD